MSRIKPFFIAVINFFLLTTGSTMADQQGFLTGATPQDRRLEPLKDLDGYFPFTPSSTPTEWSQRADQLRLQLSVATGLWPLPERHALNAVIHGRIERDTYSVEKVYFESMPGFYVCGNLYRPSDQSGKHPGILCPHGHWPNGRFYKNAPEKVKSDIQQGGEQFEQGGSSPLQARCVQLAKMGCVVFHYDMIGYADSQQISLNLAHRFAKQRPEANTVENWGLFSPQAEAHAQSIMGLQTYSSIRALDFLCELPNVDTERLAVTGASGGGTQTFLLCALDSRPVACFPAVMVSTAMQGGCTCENSCYLRVETGNIEIAALFAPKPQLLSAANDWTREMSTKGFPELLAHYRMMGAPENLQLVDRTEFQHNYNSVSRHAMYQWFNKHLKLGVANPVKEEDFQPLTTEQMCVWNAQHPAPSGGFDFERQLLRWWHEDAERQIEALTPPTATSTDSFRKVIGGAVDVLLGRRMADVKNIQFDETSRQQRKCYHVSVGWAQNQAHGESLPVVQLVPKKPNNHVVVWLDKNGKGALFSNDGNPRPAVARLLETGTTVVGVDLLFQGEFLPDGKPVERTRRVKNQRESAAYSFGYNPTLFVRRVHDVMTVLAMVQNMRPLPARIDLVGIHGAGHWAAAACAQARGVIESAAIDTAGFRFGKLLDLHHPDFVPGAAKYGDLPAMLALAAPTTLWLAGEATDPNSVVARVYQAEGATQELNQWSGTANQTEAAAIDWLTR